MIHLAAMVGVGQSQYQIARYTHTNVTGTATLLDILANEHHTVKKLIVASSMSVYGDVPASAGLVREDRPPAPASFYGCNKLASEATIRAFGRHRGLDYCILRLFNVYGPGQNMANMKQGMVSIYMSYLMAGRPVQVKGSLGRVRDFVYVDDVVDAFLRASRSAKAVGGTFNVGTGVHTSVRSLLRELLRAYGRPEWDRWVKVAGHTSGDVTGFASDAAALRRVLGWRPHWPLGRGVREMKLWCDATRTVWKGVR